MRAPGAFMIPAELAAARCYRRKVRRGTCEPVECSVLCSSRTGRTYLLSHVLVHDKQQVIVLLGSIVREDKSFSSVITHCPSDPQVAVKIVNRQYVGVDPCESLLSEIAAYQELAAADDCPPRSLARMLDAMQDEHNIYLVTEFARGGDLYGLMSRIRPGLDERLACKFFLQIVEGLIYLKRHGIAHRDVSLENVVLGDSVPGTRNSELVCQLIDLGMCVKMPESRDGRGLMVAHQNRRGKPGYVALEVVRQEPSGYCSDVWSLAICLYILLTGSPLYANPSDWAFSALAEGQARDLLTFYSSHYGLALSPLAADLIISMLNPDPLQRPTLESLFTHPWVQSMQ